MTRSLLSIDWDYFICPKNRYLGSYVENKKTTVDLWYKRYLQLRTCGKSIYNYFQLSKDYKKFWNDIRKIFIFDNRMKTYVSDSHALSYSIAKDLNCDTVYLFDAHADLGYGSLSFLDFEVNCANWLGKLFIDNMVIKAYIIYSPYTFEKPDDFKYMNDKYNIIYLKPNDLSTKINISALHICRSGAWTPPWYDDNFNAFINNLGISYEIVDCPRRKWNTNNMTFSDELYYMMV